jgi:hypothetical protein
MFSPSLGCRLDVHRKPWMMNFCCVGVDQQDGRNRDPSTPSAFRPAFLWTVETEKEACILFEKVFWGTL